MKHDGLPPHVLREYALLADGERGALVGPRGDIAWMCAPQLGRRRRLLLIDRRERLLRRDPRRSAVRLGRLLRGRLADLAQPVDHHGGRHRVPGGPGLPRRSRHRGAAAPDRGRRHPSPGAGPAGSAGRVRAARDDPPEDRGAVWTARSGPLYLRWSGGGRPGSGTAAAWSSSWTSAPGERHDLVLEISDKPLARRSGGSPRGLGGHPRPPGRRGPGLGAQPGAPGVPAQLRACWPG